ncbi:MAG: Cache 3/Cache 2 fusion domain-containing protein [Candidatus Kerfeldbacteria bacterium]|nr:Cache 3/Cache 2 fusion domain-containing protein [Candidatus Kerfeldbacteria bacterium]
MFKLGFSRLQFKVIILLVLVALLPLASLGLWGAYSLKQSRRANVAELSWQLVNQQSFQLKKFVDDRLSTFELKIADPNVQAVGPEQQRFILQSMLEQDSALQGVSFINPTGQETSHLVVGGQEVPLSNHQADPSFKAALWGQKYFGDVEFEGDKAYAVLASPVVNHESVTIAVLWGRLELSKLRQDFSRVRLGNTGYLYILTVAGELLAQSGTFPFDQSNFSPPALAKSILTGTVHQGLEDDDTYINSGGRTVLAAGVKVPALGWAVVAEWPEDEAMAPVWSLIQSLGYLSLGAFLVVLLVSFFVAAFLLRPVRVLQTGANIIGQGDFKHRISLKTHDELENLATSFNQMAKDLEALDELKAIKIRSEALAESLAHERELSKMKDTFISVSSHQLRTPLTSLKWNLELLQEEKVSAEGKDMLKGSLANTQQLTAIVEDLLLVSEFGLGYKPTNPKAVDLVKIIKQQTEPLSVQTQEKKLEFKLDLPATLTVVGDERALGILCQNIMANAVTYTKAGSITVSLTPSPHEIKLVVSDTGIGIPAIEQASIGQQFFRASNAIEQKNVGTGLGLFLIKTIAQGHGGSLAFTSQPGQGSVFTLNLPLPKSSA